MGGSRGEAAAYGLNCYLCEVHSLFLGQQWRQRVHLVCGIGWGQGKKQKPADCATMVLSKPSRKFMFQGLWRREAQLFQTALFTDGSQSSTRALCASTPAPEDRSLLVDSA